MLNTMAFHGIPYVLVCYFPSSIQRKKSLRRQRERSREAAGTADRRTWEGARAVTVGSLAPKRSQKVEKPGIYEVMKYI